MQGELQIHDRGTVMHVHGQKIRRAVSIFAAVAVTSGLVTTLTSASATTPRMAATTPTIALRGSIAGGIKITGFQHTVTFVFTETNKGTTVVDEFLDFTKVTNASVEAAECVFPGGINDNGDGNTCEPEPGLKPGQSTSIVITTQVTGTVSGTAASVQACTYNGNGGAPGPCKTVSAKIG
jgi:hypothetical protein